MTGRSAGGARGKQRALGLGFAALLLGCLSAPSARAADAPKQTKVAVGFANLVARIDKDEVGFAKPEFRVHILEALREAGYNAVGAESLVFDKDAAEKAELVLGGTVKELDCRTVDNDLRCRVGIEWQLLDRESDRVEYRVLTRFAAQGLPRDKVDSGIARTLTLGALASLLKRPRFTALLNQTELALPSDAEYPLASFACCTAGPRQLPGDFDAVADGTVVVKSGGGFGSGFLLGPDGLVMTAAHVVTSGSVQIGRRGGKTVSGRVVRLSHKQDVALVAFERKDPNPAPCLAFDPTLQASGAEAYAIGAPTSEELAFSLTRGIVSGIRTIGGVQFIQTDASLSPGNSGGALVDNQGRVIGVVSRKIAGRAVEGLGFAVPIQAALAALNLQPAADTAPALLAGGALPSKASASALSPTDQADPVPSLDPKGDRERAIRERTPGYIRPMRWGGVVLAGLGGPGVIATALLRKDQMTHDSYRSARQWNDISWAALIIGSGAFVTSFILEPHFAPNQFAGAPAWSVQLGAGYLGLNAAF